MTDDLSNKALAEALAGVQVPLVIYLVELGNLMRASREDRWAFELTAQSRLTTVEEVIRGVKERYGLPVLREYDVLKFGVETLINALPAFKGSADPRDRDLAAVIETAIIGVLRSDPMVTLRGLLAQARTYQLPNR